MWLGLPKAGSRGPVLQVRCRLQSHLKWQGVGVGERNPLDRDVTCPEERIGWQALYMSIFTNQVSTVLPGARAPQSHATDEAGTFQGPPLAALRLMPNPRLLKLLNHPRTRDAQDTCRNLPALS